jgi:hypothetical protein
MRVNPLNIHIVNLSEAKPRLKTGSGHYGRYAPNTLPFCLGVITTFIVVVLVCLIGGKLHG